MSTVRWLTAALVVAIIASGTALLHRMPGSSPFETGVRAGLAACAAFAPRAPRQWCSTGLIADLSRPRNTGLQAVVEAEVNPVG